MTTANKLNKSLLADEHITVDDLEYSLQLSHGSAYQIIHDNLGFWKVSARWLPRELMVDHKQRHLGICQLLLNARPHAATKTVETIDQLGFTVQQHSVYSPDLGASDYHLFGSLKDAL